MVFCSKDKECIFRCIKNINRLLSVVACLLSGVIQGIFIGPLMFRIYINDLVIVALLAQHCIKVKLFADDVKLYVKIVNRVDIRKLQLALSAHCDWAAE